MNNKGYTVIEVIIATVIFVTAITIATASFVDGLKLLKNISEKDQSIFKLSKNIWIDSLFLCITDYFVFDETDKRFYLYFDGSSDTASFVTECPLNNNLPSLVYITKQANSNGSYDLNLYQMTVSTMDLRDIERVIIFSDIKKSIPYKLVEDASLVYINYLVYDRKTKLYSWKSDYKFRQYYTLPSAIKITYQKDGYQNQLFFKILNTNSSKNIYNEFYYGR